MTHRAHPATPLSRRALLGSAGVLFLGAVTACKDKQTATAPKDDLRVPLTLPSTFRDTALWRQAITPKSTPVACPEGVALVVGGKTDKKAVRVALVAPASGTPRWHSREFTAPEGAAVSLHSITTPQDSWVLAIIESSTNERSLHLYQAAGTGEHRDPLVSTTLKGIGTEAPVIRVTGQGITAYALDGGTPEAGYVLDPATLTPTPWNGPGNLSGAWADLQVVQDITPGAGVAVIAGGTPLWTAADKRPDAFAGTASALAAFGDGLVLTRWDAEETVDLAVHEVRTGKVLGTLVGADASVVEGRRRFMQTDGGAWAVWGDLAIALKGGKSRRLELHGGTPTMGYREVLYVQGAGAPLVAASGGPSDAGGASDGGGEASDAGGAEEESGRFAGIVDIATGVPLTNVKAETVPLFMSAASQGLVVVDDDSRSFAYSVPLA